MISVPNDPMTMFAFDANCACSVRHANLLSTDVRAVKRRSFNGRNIYCSRLVIDGNCVDMGIDMGEYRAPRVFTASLFRCLASHAVSGVEMQWRTLPWWA